MNIMPNSLRQRIRGIMFKLPLMITCAEFEDFIVAYIDGELAPKQKRIFEFHLAVCPECRNYLAAYRSAMSITRNTLDAQTADMLENVPEDLISAVLAARQPQKPK